MSAGCFDTAHAATQRDRLAGYYAGGGGAFVHGVGVHHPGHGLRVGVYIGRGYVFVGSDDYADLAGVAACDALEFPTGVVAGVDASASLGSAQRQVYVGERKRVVVGTRWPDWVNLGG